MREKVPVVSWRTKDLVRRLAAEMLDSQQLDDR